MKKNAFHTVFYLFSVLLSFSAAAQSLADFGNARLIIENGDLKGAYNYLMENGAPLSFSEDADGGYADFSFASDFGTKQGGSHWIQCVFRITPPGKGVYPFKDPSVSESPAMHADLSINIDNKLILQGSKGSIVITNYPATDGYLTGTFNATVHDIAETISYKVSGAFKIKRF